MVNDTQSLRRARVLPPGSYSMGGVTLLPERPRRSRAIERASALIDLQLDPVLREAFMLWAQALRERNPVAKSNLNQQFEVRFYKLDGSQMLKLAHVIDMVKGKQ